MKSTFEERYNYWHKVSLNIDYSDRTDLPLDYNYDYVALKSGPDIEKIKEEAIAEIMEMYGVSDRDVELHIRQEAKKGLFIKKDASVFAELKFEKKKELICKFEKAALEKAKEKEAEFSKEKDLLNEEISKEMISKLKDIVEYFPELLFANMRSLHFDVLNYCADQGKNISDLNVISEDLLYAWYLFSSSDINEVFTRSIDILLTELLLKYEGKKVLERKNLEHEGMGFHLNYSAWVEGMAIDLNDYVAQRVLPLSCGVFNNIDDRERGLLENNRSFAQSIDYSDDSLVKNREFIIGKYLENLYIVPLMWNDMQKAHVLIECEELFNIVYNNENGSLVVGKMTTVYDIYKRYYSNLWPDVLSEPQFRNVANMALLIKDKENYLQKYYELLKNEGVDVKQILTKGMTEKKDNMSFLYYFIDNVLENGEIDCIIGHDEYERFFSILMYCICDSLLEYYDDVEIWLSEMIQALAATESVEVYRNRYVLLHPNTTKKNAVDEIRTKLNEAVTGEDFEIVLKLLYEQLGYDVSMTKTTGDQGADLIMEKNGTKVVVQAKYYSSPVGNSAVQEVVGALKYYGAQKAIVVTNNTYTNAAIELAKYNNVQLVDGHGLETLIDSIV